MRKPKPIQDPAGELESIIGVISDPTALAKVAARFGNGPSLYFYRKLLSARRNAGNVDSFMSDPNNLELGYALLGLWGMDTRGAIGAAVGQVHAELVALDAALTKGNNGEIIQILETVYDGLHLMQGKNKLISNAKLLHFLFPDHLMPMDGENTLTFFYGKNTSESKVRYLEITQFLFRLRSEMLQRQINWVKCMDGGWNSNFPKMFDNAVFSLVRKEEEEAKEKRNKDG